jgi:hypothetical protein
MNKIYSDIQVKVTVLMIDFVTHFPHTCQDYERRQPQGCVSVGKNCLGHEFTFSRPQVFSRIL